MHLPTSWSCRLLAVVSLLAAATVRADDAVPWDVPLFFDSAGRYMMGVSMSNLTGQQNFSFAFSTSTGLITVASDGGNLGVAAGGPPLYNQSKSVTAENVDTIATTSLFGESTDSSIIKETCALAGIGQLWTYSNQTIVLVKNATRNSLTGAANAQIGEEVSGIVGFGTNRQAAIAAAGTPNESYIPQYEDSFIGQFFHNWPEDANFIFGVQLNSPVVVPSPNGGVVPVASAASRTGNGVLAGSDAGVVHLLWSDPGYYKTEGVAWVWVDPSATPTVENATVPPSDWAIVLDGWVASTQNTQLSSKGKIVADLDPLYTGIYIPQDQAEVIHASIPGATLKQGISTLGNLSMSYTVPCDTQLSFGIVIGQQTFILDQSTLIVKMSNGECVSSLEAWTNPFMTSYMFGARFASQLYLVFSVNNNGTQSIGFAPLPTSSKSSLDVKAVVGGTVGGAALLVLTIIGAFFLRRYYRRTAHTGVTVVPPHMTEREEDPKSPGAGWHVEPFTAGPTRAGAGAYGVSPTKAPGTPPGALPALVPNRMSEHGSPATTEHTLSPLPSGVIFLNDDRSVHAAPPSYRDAPAPPSPSTYTAHTSQTGASGNFSTRAACGV